MLNVSVFLSILIASGGRHSVRLSHEISKYLIIVNAIAIAAALLLHTYKNILKRGYYKELVSVIKYVLSVFLVVVLYIFAIENNSSDIIKNILYFTVAIFFVLSYFVRLFYKSFYATSSAKRKALRFCLLQQAILCRAFSIRLTMRSSALLTSLESS